MQGRVFFECLYIGVLHTGVIIMSTVYMIIFLIIKQLPLQPTLQIVKQHDIKIRTSNDLSTNQLIILIQLMPEHRHVFIAQYYDINSSQLKNFNLIYFHDHTIELVTLLHQYDLKNKKIFLKRNQYPSLQLKDLWIGSVVTIYSKQFRIIDYADTFTKNALQEHKNKTFSMIKPDSYLHIGKIISILQHHSILSNLKMARLSKKQVMQFYAQHQGKPFFNRLVEYISSDFVVGMQLVGTNVITNTRSLLGPTNSQKARSEAPNSIRALYGVNETKNACHGSDSQSSAKRELSYFFNPSIKVQNLNESIPILNNCTLCIIKPHIIQNKEVGQIIDQILMAGFQISAMQWILMDTPTSLQFFQPYKGVLPQYSELCSHMSSGPSIALQLRQQNAVQLFRTLCGPHDPAIAKVLRPESLRGRYGKDRVKNAVHCTDLSEDGRLQVNFIFNVIGES